MIGPTGLDPLAQEIVRHTLDDRPVLAAALLDVVGEHGDSADMYGVCCVAAEVARGAMQALYPDAGMTVREYWALPDHTSSVLDEHRLFARRFLVAQLNRDAPMSLALYSATEGRGYQDRQESVCALLACARDLVRHAEAGPAISEPGGIPT
ncbi:hypothetical protein [Streptomyces sp. 111WW2]|uniref:hypothetical protein n=1 Tax=Streptomyces sp. 111WW2 TaxID=1945515 RepID=UPI000D0C75C8|nr:hypothetical protein [Streptomyces sp. 111WW2]